jgi:hypothetical protein
MDRVAARRLDWLIWTLMAGVGAIVLTAPFVSNFSIEWSSFVPPGAVLVLMLALSKF